MLVKSNDRVPQYEEVQYVIFTETKLSSLWRVWSTTKHYWAGNKESPPDLVDLVLRYLQIRLEYFVFIHKYLGRDNEQPGSVIISGQGFVLMRRLTPFINCEVTS